MAVLQYDFAVVGADKVKRAFASIERRAAVHNAKMNKLFGVTSSGRPVGGGVGGAGKPVKHWPRQQAKEEIAGQRAVAREAARAAREKERAAKRYGQIQARQHRADLAHIRRQRREAQRASMAALRERRRVAGATLGRAGRSTTGALRAVGGTVGGALTLGGGIAAGAAVSSVMRQEAAASALANQAYREGGPSRESIRRSVLSQSQRLGVSSGLGVEGVIGGLRQMTSISGRLDIGQQLAPFMADLANATDADIGDVGRTTGQIVQAMAARGLSDVEILDQTTDILAAMAGQAKVGSIEFADLATQMGKVMSATAGYEGSISDLAGTMGAVAQLAIAGGASSPEEAMTSILRMRDAFVKNAGRFEKQGVNVFTDESRTQVRDPIELLQEVLGKTGGDLTKLSKLFGIRSTKAVQPFQEAFRNLGGDPAAIAKLLESVKGAKMTRGEIRESAAFRVSQTDRQASVAFEDFKTTVGNELLPELVKLIPIFKELVPTVGVVARVFAKLVESLVDSPLTTLGTMIAAKVAGDLALARIGEAAKGAIVNSIGASGGGGALGGKVSAAAALGGAAINGLSIGAVTGMVIYAKGVTEFHASEQRMAKGGQAVLAAEEAAAKGDVAGARAAWLETRALTDESQQKSGMEQFLSAATKLMYATPAGLLALPFTGGAAPEQAIAESTGMATERRTAEAQEARARAAVAKAEREAAEALKRAADKMATSVNRGDTPTPSNSNR